MAATRSTGGNDTRSAILDSAERLAQSRGFNGFSYSDVATELGITTAAVHYHFPGKAELGEALVRRYAARFNTALAEIDADGAGVGGKLRAYCNIYLAALREHRMCLCGMLAAEYQTLPDAMRDALINFFDQNQAWLAHLLEEGRSARSMRFAGSATQAAQMTIAALEGAMLVAGPYRSTGSFEAVAARLIAEFVPEGGE